MSHRFWIVHGGTPTSVQTYLKHHVPRDLKLVETGQGAGADGVTFTEVIDAIGASRQFAWLTIVTSPMRRGAAVRADAVVAIESERCSHA